jgi:hypothetical protein
MAEDTVLTVGGAISSLCTKCRMATRHVVVSVVAGRAGKVQCSACQGVHNYRDPSGGGAPGRRGTGGSGRGSGAGSLARTPEEDWLAHMKGRDPREAILYGGGGRVQPGDLVEHPSLGFGLVRKVIPPNRAEIQFRDGLRLLRWGG